MQLCQDPKVQMLDPSCCQFCVLQLPQPREGRQGCTALNPQLRCIFLVPAGAEGSSSGFAACGSHSAQSPELPTGSTALSCPQVWWQSSQAGGRCKLQHVPRILGKPGELCSPSPHLSAE